MRAGGERPRVVLLGASNLTSGFGAAVAAARSFLGGGPIDVFAAAGHGRSYGTWSRVVFRGLPGILESGLWSALDDRAPEAPLRALITDVGNDLAYGYPAPRVADWVEACARRLAAPGRASGGGLVLTLLPASSLDRYGPLRFLFFRSILYPGRRFTLAAVRRAMEEVNERIRSLAAELGAVAVDPDRAWFGPDGIHVRRAAWTEAWARLMSGWREGARPPGTLPAPTPPLRLSGLAPERRTVLGVELHRPQPSGELGDGTRIWMY